VIGIDPYGTRILFGTGDPILKAEREAFVKRFLVYLYNYDETNFDERISSIGDSMRDKIWDSKKSEFIGISKQLKSDPLVQKAKIVDLRELDERHYQADLEVHIESRLRKKDVKLRVGIEISAAARTIEKPFPWIVESYDEQVAN
jgi:hypothetical protein